MHLADFQAYLAGNPGMFDLIFLDPPYRGETVNRALESIAQIDILSDGGIIVCETERDKKLVDLAPPYQKGREYLYGKTKITIYRKG